MLEGWKRVALEDVAEFRNGLNFTRGEQGHSVKVVGVGDFQKHETLSDFGGTSVVTVTNRIAENDLLKDDDLLFVPNPKPQTPNPKPQTPNPYQKSQ